MIDWVHFTYWPSLVGGLLLGGAAAMLLLLTGKVAGISGILGALLRPKAKDRWWRIAFILGLASSPLIYQLFASLPIVQVEADTPTLIVAGLLVGLGTRYGSGCTSGHGVCGLSRLSLRSLVATVAFMLSGFVTVFIARHLLT